MASRCYYILVFLVVGLVPVIDSLTNSGHRFWAITCSMIGLFAGIALLYLMCKEAFEEISRNRK